MAPSTSVAQFIDIALSCSSPALSYQDPKQKWPIREHILSLIQDYPSFTPSIDTFTYNDGTAVNLLTATGDLRVSSSTPPVPLTIWLHENYPFVPPMVFVSSNSVSPVRQGHPFVDPSGATRSPYLETWMSPRCNLAELVRNLANLFSIDHPFTYSSPRVGFNHPSFASKMEALDRLSGKLHYDIIALQDKNSSDIEELSRLQAEMVPREDIVTSMIIGLENEKRILEDRVMDLRSRADVLINWLKVNRGAAPVVATGENLEDIFEVEDEKSRMVIECLAANKAIEDLIYALDKAVEQEVVTFDAYLKQVRVLAREQFQHRAMLLKLRGPQVLLWSD